MLGAKLLRLDKFEMLMRDWAIAIEMKQPFCAFFHKLAGNINIL